MHTSTSLLGRIRPALFLIPLTIAVLVSACPAQVPGVTREQMWWSPTAADWQKPVLITFQRNWDDAVAVSEETGKAILICVNMDGEIASEHYAGIRYREPEKAALYEPYVCVIASVYRHTPRDYDEQGQPILCPRFGSVTCGDHIAIEPYLYERFFDEQRIAPRHIMVELDGEETYDVFYIRDTDGVFAAINDGIANRPFTPQPIVRGDRTIIERVASRDLMDRNAVEAAYRDGDPQLRQSLLEAAVENSDKDPLGLLRLAVFGFDPELSRVARTALAQSDSANAVDLIAEAMRVPMEEAQREALISALQRIGETSPRARTLAVVHRGLGTTSTEINVEDWSTGLAGAEYPAPPDWVSLESDLDDKANESAAQPADPQAQLELAKSALSFAISPETQAVLSADPRTQSKYTRLMFEDAYRAAVKAAELGATGWEVDAAISLSAYYTGNLDEADTRAEAAVKGLPSGEQGELAFATLELFVQGKHQAIVDASRENRDWPQQWLTDVSATYTILGRHPRGTEMHFLVHYDFLKWLRADGRASAVLDEGLGRFPSAWLLHDRLRGRVLEENGVEGLHRVYEAMLGEESASPNLEWFAGYASMVAAEFHRRRPAGEDRALTAYDRAIAHYERFIERDPENRDSADHYIAMALAGGSRIAFEREDFDRALAELLASFERKPEAAGTLDGLNISPADTSRQLRSKFTELGREDLLTRLEAALGELDPELLQLPAYETVGQRGRGGRGGRRGRRGRRGGE